MAESITVSRINEDDLLRGAAAKIIELIEAGKIGQWEKRWNGLSSMPFNPVTKASYTGVNRFLLLSKMIDMESSDSRFLTFNQAVDLNKAKKEGEEAVFIRKNEKALYILRPVTIKYDRKTKDEGSSDGNTAESEGKRVFFKPYPVFHASQINGMPDLPEPEKIDWDKNSLIEDLLSDSGADIRKGGDRAFFSSSSDYIQVPHAVDFSDNQGYYTTLLHEWYHWTGHTSRDNREFGKTFGDELYAKEELRAESFSVLSGVALGLSVAIENHANYIDSWKTKLDSKEGVKEIIAAINQAGKMLDVVLDFKAGTQPSVDWWQSQENDDLRMGM